MDKCYSNIEDFVNENVLLVKADDPTNCEYQVRYIDGPIFYKRQRGQETWKFTNAEEFAKNVGPHNIVPWNNSDC